MKHARKAATQVIKMGSATAACLVLANAFVLESAIAAEATDICQLAEVRKKFPAAIKAKIPEAEQVSAGRRLGEFGGEWGMEDVRNAGTYGDGAFCQATLHFDYLKPDESFATLHYPDSLFYVQRAHDRKWIVTLYHSPSMGGSTGGNQRGTVTTQDDDGLSAEDIARNKKVDDDMRRLESWGQKIQAQDAEETRRRKGPCEQAGGTWGYYQGKLGCYFRTIGN